MNPFKRWLQQRRQTALRETRLSEIAALGYALERIEASPVKRYRLRTPEGRILDNEGMGFSSTGEALRAARYHSSVRSLMP